MLFGSAFGVVFALGFQSLSVNAGHYRLAFCNSVLIGIFNLFLYKTVPNVHSAREVVIYVFAGPMGLMCAMALHARLKNWLNRDKPVEFGADTLPSGIRIHVPQLQQDEIDRLIEWDRRDSVGRYGAGRYGAR